MPSTNSLWSFARFLKWGIAIAAVGYVPLQLYIVFGPRDGNPVGLGLLFVVCMFAGMLVAGIGLLKVLWQLLTDREK